jgi:predicted dehydrogenase
MDQVIRLGVIGAGWFASRRHLPEAHSRSDIELAAICRRDAGAREAIAAHFGLANSQCFEDWEQMLDTASLDAVLIATPNNIHYTIARACLERGLHVLLEKPMTITSADAWSLVTLAAKHDKTLCVALNPPYWAHCHRMKAALQSEAMGELESAAIYWTGSAAYVFGRAPAPESLPGIVPPTQFRADPELNGGGYFIDGGSHLVSELLWVSSRRAVRVACIMDSTPTDMRSVITIVLDKGAVCTINSIGDSHYSSRRVSNIFGAAGGVVTVTGFEFDTTIAIDGAETQRFKEADLPNVSSPLANFCEAIRGTADLYSSAEHGAHVVDVVEAAYESARSGRTIEIPDRRLNSKSAGSLPN